jgi:hypothetical protein
VSIAGCRGEGSAGPVDVDTHEPGGGLLATAAVAAVHTPTEASIGIKLARATERANVAEVGALGLRAEGEVGRGYRTLPRREDMREEGEGALEMPP